MKRLLTAIILGFFALIFTLAITSFIAVKVTGAPPIVLLVIVSFGVAVLVVYAVFQHFERSVVTTEQATADEQRGWDHDSGSHIETERGTDGAKESETGDKIDDPFLSLHPVSPITPGVLEELQRLEGPRGSMGHGLSVLAISLMIFIGAERSIAGSATFIIDLVIVLAIHEAGHWLAMRLFGYRDLKVFFIPFIGAAVTGNSAKATGVQRAVVSLAGPLPGLFLSMVLMFGNGLGAWSVDGELPLLMLILNVFNLLPFEPLDGGRLMNVLLYQRFPRVEGAMRVLGAVTMIALAVAWEDIFLGLFGGLFALGITRGARLAKAAEMLRPSLTETELSSSVIPSSRRDEVAHLVATEVLVGVDVYSQPKQLARGMMDLWCRALLAPPSTVGTMVLLTAYLLIVGGLTTMYLLGS